MFKRMNWLVMWLVGAVTLNIYAIYAWYTMGKQQNRMAAQLGERPLMNYIAVFFLGFVTCGIVPLVWLYQFMKQQIVLAQAKGVELTPCKNPIALWLLMIVPIYSLYVVCANHNKLCGAYEE